jgi:hypothetical protein
MRQIDPVQVLKRANEVYAERKIGVIMAKRIPPEKLPIIQSDQARAILEAVVEAVNAALKA